jgi:hypothetical protein
MEMTQPNEKLHNCHDKWNVKCVLLITSTLCVILKFSQEPAQLTAEIIVPFVYWFIKYDYFNF